jgi:uncharacterized membrane protein
MARGDWIRIVLVLHVIGAIMGLGTNLTYGLITSVGERAGGERRVFALGLIQTLDRRLANPAYMAQLVTGLLLVWLLKLNLFATSWLLLGLVLYITVAVLGITVYAPVLRRQAALAEELASEGVDGAAATEYGAVARRSRQLGILATALVVVIVTLMVTKPALW